MKTKLHSDSPLARAVVCALLSAYETYRSSLTLGRSCQYPEARSSSTTPAWVKDFSVYGPEPIGFLLTSVPGSLIFSQMCFGTIGVCAMILTWLTNCGDSKVTCTTLPLAVILPNGISFAF